MTPWAVSSRRCNVCTIEKFYRSDQLQLCSGCRLIRYCSAEHQQLDWPIHKSFCSAIKHILKKSTFSNVMDLEGPVTSWRQFEKALILTKCLVHTILKRELDMHEVELLTFPAHCQVCFSRNGKVLFNCENCTAVSYCSVEHQTSDFAEHSKWCKHLRYYYNFHELENFSLELDFSSAPVLAQTNIPKDLFSLIDVTRAPDTIELSRIPRSLDEYQYYAAVSNYSCVATLLHVITTCKLNDDNDTLTVYLIGSRDEHLFLQESHCSFLCSQLPTVDQIKFYLIGPEAPRLSNPINYTTRSQNHHKTKIQINFQREKFEDFAKRVRITEDSSGPHLIAAFNCGFYEFARTAKDTWKEGIVAMLQYDRTPIVFTSYTKLEARFDLRQFSECATANKREYQIIVNGEENPYRDQRPFRNMELHDRRDLVYFRNGYLHIVLVNSRV